jgi:GT2 family glycosyltransferase/glycosyltransferase involved in cell wall biosynthesis/SAM-dependent methyltransferase
VRAVDRHGAAWVAGERPVLHRLLDRDERWRRWRPNAQLRIGAAGAFEITGNDPWLIGPEMRVRTGAFRYLFVRMRARSDSPRPAAQLFWASRERAGFIEGQSVRWNVTPDGESRAYVVDLHETAWPTLPTVARFRLDPLDAPGSVEIDEMAVLADLAVLRPGDLREPLARRYLRGIGIECGALQKTLPVPSYARVLYVDRLTREQARAHYPELDAQPLVAPDIIGDVHRLPLENDSVDFCIGNHLLEHARDPMAGLEEMLRVVRPGGVVYVSVPDARNPLDCRRPATEFSHLLEHHAGTLDQAADDAIHYREYVDSAHADMDSGSRNALVQRYLAERYSIHFHTFDEVGFRRLLGHVCDAVGATVVEFSRNPGPDFDEYVAVVRRGRGTSGAVTQAPGVDIVVPIHDARDDTVRCIESVLHHMPGGSQLVLVDDASKDPELVAALDRVAATDGRVRLLRHEANRGFVATANAGMRQREGRDVLLLNSDTVVTAGFLERLQAAAYADDAISIVSPLSNNATICSVPEWCKANRIPEGFTVDTFARLVAETSLQLRPDLPSAHGFCMYIPGAVLDAIGLFDEENFGRGFGEENDLCERAMAIGFRVRLADDAFVYHKGSASFGDETAEELKRRHYQTLERLHPTYFAKVARFVETNPLSAVHGAVQLAIRRRSTPVPALLALLHASFDRPRGGSEHHVRDLVRAVRLPRVVVAVPEADGIHLTEVLDGRLDNALHYRLPLTAPPARFMHAREDFDDALRTIVRLFGVGAVHFQHFCNWPVRAWRTFATLGIPFVATFQDFYCVCPNLNLFDPERDRLCCASTDPADRDVHACMRGIAQTFGLPPIEDPDRFTRALRTEFTELLHAARHLVFPAVATRDIVARFHALDPARTRVIPHGYSTPSRRLQRPRRPGPINIALLGEVAHTVKGARRYPALIDRTRDLPIVWHVFGQAEHLGFGDRLRALGLGSRIRFHGPYRREGICDALARAEVDLVVLLPPWPETFSYTLSEALTAGIPVVVSDQGALPERVREGGYGVVVSTLDEAVATVTRLVRDHDALARLRERVATFRHRTVEEMADDYRPLYRDLMAAAPEPASATVEERRLLLEAWEAAPPPPSGAAEQVVPPLPHYERSWYRFYARVAHLIPAGLRRWGSRRVRDRWWPPVQAYRFADEVAIGTNDGLELVRATRRRAAYRILHDDPSFVLGAKPFSPRRVRAIRFEMRCETSGAAYAQVYWNHRAGEDFSEDKSVRIPITPGGSWREYVVCIDETDRRDFWDAGDEIRQLRFDPLNARGIVELRELLLCSVSGENDGKSAAS